MTVDATHVGYAARLAEALPSVRERIARAAELSGRGAASVRLVAVTKSHPLEAVRAAVGAGLHDLGENRVSELEDKATAFGPGPVRWHMIGHVQGRKARRAAEVAHLIHSVDSLRLAERLSRWAVEEGRAARVLAQVNTAEEDTKSGFEPDSALESIHRVSELPGLRVEGLMTMAPFVDDVRVLVAAFTGLRELLVSLRAVAPGIGPELSMGMTNDLEVAVREGSTMVRIGTALFGERE